MLRHVIWCRESVWISATLQIFRAGVLLVLLCGSETWSITKAQERRINTFYMRCLRTIIGVNRGDKMSNETLLEITGQPLMKNILRRNRLR